MMSDSETPTILTRKDASLDLSPLRCTWPQVETDNWSTPQLLWKELRQWIHPEAVIWDPCYNEGRSKIYLEDLGYVVVSEKKNLFEWTPANIDVIVTNPPFSNMEEVLSVLFALNKPMVLLLPARVWKNQWFRTLVNGRDVDMLQIATPIRFIKGGVQANKGIMDSMWILVDIGALQVALTKKKPKLEQADDI